ncbi:MAG: DUF115 domain-containing protein [Treponema sp.]|nr:DUF115 domain-containing protein [Treponema sp.]
MDKTHRYIFLKSRGGETVPAIVLSQDNTQPLHSMIDPKREAERLVSTITNETGFLIILGLGGGFIPEAALKMTGARILVIDYDKNSITELFNNIDYSGLLNNGRFTLLIDPSNEEIKKYILENYNPALYGGIKTIPLRTRTEHDKEKFTNAAAIIQESIEIISTDYSVQSRFGLRWFSNIIRNISLADISNENYLTEKTALPIQNAAIAAAGPSLDHQISYLAELKSQNTYIISTDTALGVLLNNKIYPDAVVSIDCQFISYYHFMGNNLPNDIPLILDIASPPMLAGFSSLPVFFSSGHPLALYINNYWRPFIQLDTSGGNVTYACLSLAEVLGASHITLFGADFSYINCQTYARGTYINPYFSKMQNRLSPIEAQSSALLYRSLFLSHEKENSNYYETSSLRFYRKNLEEKAAGMKSVIISAPGYGAPINLVNKRIVNNVECGVWSDIKAGVESKERKTLLSGEEFLRLYSDDIAGLPKADRSDDYMLKLNGKDRQVFTTLLPLAAAIKRRNGELNQNDLIEEVKRYSINKIECVLAK